MDEQRLAEIWARLNAATPGPWRYAARSATIEDRAGIVASVGVRADVQHRAEDAEFIAHAPADMLALLAEVDRLYDIVRGYVNHAGDQETRREIVQAVAERSVDDYDRCILATCDPTWDADAQRWVHAADCLVTKAQADQGSEQS